MGYSFTADFFAGNRKKLRQLFTGTAPIVISANGLMQRSGDSVYPFTQDANFWYLTGIDSPDIILVFDRDREYLIVPDRSMDRDIFEGSIDKQNLAERSGIQTIYSQAEGWETLAARLKKVKHAATLAAPPEYVEHFGFYSNPARQVLISKIKSINEQIGLLDISPHLMRMRMIKQPQEISAIREAVAITISGIKAVISPAKLRKYNFEYEIEAELLKQFRIRGSSGPAFEPIIASGVRACTLHNTANDSSLRGQRLVLMDVGASVNHYAADISRTVAISEPTKRQRDVHLAVNEVLTFAVSLLKPGVMPKDYELQVSQFMGEKLRELNLAKTIKPEITRRFFPHAVSHFLGLNVHDAGDYQRPLEAGMVLTVEPGIYIPKEGIGIRIEDDILITEKGAEILGAKLSRELN